MHLLIHRQASIRELPQYFPLKRSTTRCISLSPFRPYVRHNDSSSSGLRVEQFQVQFDLRTDPNTRACGGLCLSSFLLCWSRLQFLGADPEPHPGLSSGHSHSALSQVPCPKKGYMTFISRNLQILELNIITGEGRDPGDFGG